MKRPNWPARPQAEVWADQRERVRRLQEFHEAEREKAVEVYRELQFVKRHPKLVGELVQKRYGPTAAVEVSVGITIYDERGHLGTAPSLRKAICYADARRRDRE